MLFWLGLLHLSHGSVLLKPSTISLLRVDLTLLLHRRLALAHRLGGRLPLLILSIEVLFDLLATLRQVDVLLNQRSGLGKLLLLKGGKLSLIGIDASSARVRLPLH